jgi:hypothetical protein
MADSSKRESNWEKFTFTQEERHFNRMRGRSASINSAPATPSYFANSTEETLVDEEAFDSDHEEEAFAIAYKMLVPYHSKFFTLPK